jgi:hypothetical protein
MLNREACQGTFESRSVTKILNLSKQPPQTVALGVK